MESLQYTIRSKLRIVYMIFFVWEREKQRQRTVCVKTVIEFLFWEMENEDLVWHARSHVYLGTDFSTEYLFLDT